MSARQEKNQSGVKADIEPAGQNACVNEPHSSVPASSDALQGEYPDPQQLREYYTNEQMLNQCFTMMLSAESLDDSLNGILAQVGKYLCADRCYIFRYCSNGAIVQNTHEWTAEGISPEIDTLQWVPSDFVADWTSEFNSRKP